jgi:hypothetical protein
MSLCMSSAQKGPRAASLRHLASRTSSTPPWTTNSKFSIATRCRWNSSNSAPKRIRIEDSRSKGGWATWKVFGLAAVTGILAHVLATNAAKERTLKDREYSNPGKFVEPKYASVQEMEAVSLLSLPKPLFIQEHELKVQPRQSRKSAKQQETKTPSPSTPKTSKPMATPNGPPST